MELLAYWKIVRRRLWLIILIMLLGGIGASYYSLQQPIQYEATTTLFLNSAVAKSVLGSLNRESVQSLANTYTEFMHTSSFAHRVATELGVPLSEKEVEEALSAKYVPDTQFFRITAVHTDTRLAQSLANTAAQVLIAENTVRQQTEQQQIAAQRTHSGPESQQRMVELRKALEDELVSYNDQIKGLQDQIGVLQKDAADEKSEQRLQQLRDALINLQSSRVNVLNSLVRAQSDIESNPTNIAPNTDTAVVVDTAPLPIVPLSRRTIEYTLLAFIVSLVLGLGLAFLLEYLDYTIKSPDDLESVYGDPALGVVRALPRKWWGERRQMQLITVSDPYSPSAEAFRVMRIGIQSAGLDAPVHSLLITSAMPHEGKTFVATNLAVSLAQNGSRVILVDADWRKPGLHDIFCLAREPGFTNLLFGRREDLATLLQHTEVENLRVLTCGTISPKPAELLNSQRVIQVMEQLIESADVVIYDSPPALTVTDALVLAPRVDAVLQIVLAGNTRIDLVLRCKAVLERAGARILGPVLNRVNQRDFGEYAPGYGYYYRTPKPVASHVLGWLMPRHKQQAEPTELLSGVENLTEAPQAGAVLAQGEVDGQDFLRANGRGRRIQ
ncbi:MAG: polysaccharide biosynthesis tyrosine autokinase [Roseiflexaceae bacterium]